MRARRPKKLRSKLERYSRMPVPRFMKTSATANSSDGEASMMRERDVHVDVAGAEEAVAERVHHVQDGVRVRQVPRPLRQQGDGIEHAAEVRERRQHERRDPVHLVEVLREHAR